MKQKGISFMAVATGQESKEIVTRRFIGIGALGVVAVNPTRAEQNNILEQNFSNEEIKYVGEATVKDKNNQDINVPQIRISVLMKTDPEIACNNGLEEYFFVNFFLNKAAQYSFKDGVTKMQVIDKYGRTAWVTPEQAQNHVVPEYIIKNGPRAGQTMKANICADYRVAYQGEENLVKFICAFLCIPRPDAWDPEKKAYVMKTDAKELAKSECLLDDIKKYFDGNVSEVDKVLKFQKKNRVKLLIGVRTAQNGSQYQDVYTQMPLRLSTTSYKEWEEALKADKQFGRHPNTEYRVCNLMEFKTQATDYSTEGPDTTEANDPFAASNQNTEVQQVVAEAPLDVDPFEM